MARSLTIATTASEAPMGAQAYETAISLRAGEALERAGNPMPVKHLVSRSIRSNLPGDRRLPMHWLHGASPAARKAIGKFIYPKNSVVHRMDLVLPPPPGPDVITLHDMVAWRFEDESKPVPAAPEELRAADAVICVSEYTAQQAYEHLGLDNVTVAHNGVDDRYFAPPPISPDWLLDRGIDGPFFLYAGGSAARKNLPGLATAWELAATLLPEWRLVLAGPTSDARARLFARTPRVVHLGRVDDAVMPSLVSASGCVVVPSLHEGFGLPALEGMAAGVPVVSSNRTSLPEVIGDAGILVDPTGEQLAEGLLAVGTGSIDLVPMIARGRARARHFTWRRSADTHAKVWSHLL